ncbi:hypothetical protein [Flagellimonas abyssi]|uniref:DUF4145 domain-containing protein n=1 Tax=Flagellimonas abyssi TaxID=2864871 RepID=A0ABS7EPR0_9FLAO|nr:hypothetical protein [Allomuricauda abyssi]MBW8199536.1 hypothetical protein [Allomuricauda abyssi]
MENIITKGTGFSEYEARIKVLVLSSSVRFENLASMFLRTVLKLEDSAISTGNTSQALSMNQKLILLLDSKLLDKEYKKYIKTFFDIRNQFVHNASAKSFEDCLTFLDGTENFLEKKYKDKRTANEKAGGERAAKEKADDEINNMELLSFNISDKEKLLYKYWVSLAEDVIIGFEKMMAKIYPLNDK